MKLRDSNLSQLKALFVQMQTNVKELLRNRRKFILEQFLFMIVPSLWLLPSYWHNQGQINWVNKLELKAGFHSYHEIGWNKKSEILVVYVAFLYKTYTLKKVFNDSFLGYSTHYSFFWNGFNYCEILISNRPSFRSINPKDNRILHIMYFFHIVSFQIRSWILYCMLPISARTLPEKCPNTEFFLVLIFLYSNWIWTRQNSVFRHFSRSGKVFRIVEICETTCFHLRCPLVECALTGNIFNLRIHNDIRKD